MHLEMENTFRRSALENILVTEERFTNFSLWKEVFYPNLNNKNKEVL